MIDWLYRTSLEVSLLVGLVLVLRPFVRRALGAHIAYWLWVIPLARCFVWYKPEIQLTLVERVKLSDSEALLRVFPNPENFIIPQNLPLEWVWIIGLILWVTTKVISWRRFQVDLKAQSSEVEKSQLSELLDLEFKDNSKIDFFFTGIPSAPFVTGLLQPKVYLPEDFFERYSKEQQRFILAHEMAHIKRKDLWVQFLGESVRSLFWFNPVVHLAWRALREDQELACDRYVLRNSDDRERFEYGQALIKGIHAHLLPSTLTFFSKKKERFIMLDKHKSSKLNNIAGITLCVLISVFAFTKAPLAIANDEGWNEKLTLKFEDIPLSEPIKIISEFVGIHLVAPEELLNIKTSISIENVKAIDAANAILACHGYEFEVHKLGELKTKEGYENLISVADEYGDSADAYLVVKIEGVSQDKNQSKLCISSNT